MFCQIFMAMKPLLSASKHGYLSAFKVFCFFVYFEAVSMQCAFLWWCSEPFSTTCQRNECENENEWNDCSCIWQTLELLLSVLKCAFCTSIIDGSLCIKWEKLLTFAKHLFAAFCYFNTVVFASSFVKNWNEQFKVPQLSCACFVGQICFAVIMDFIGTL